MSCGQRASQLVARYGYRVVARLQASPPAIPALGILGPWLVGPCRVGNQPCAVCPAMAGHLEGTPARPIASELVGCCRYIVGLRDAPSRRAPCFPWIKRAGGGL